MSGYYDSNFDRYLQRTDDSKSHKLKNAYWTTKQAMIAKLRRKQDENIVASDADLDSKLELLKSVQNTCRDLNALMNRYQRTVCYLSQAENEMGRFLKQSSLEDRTQAGKIMAAVGKALSTSAHQRLTLLGPIDRVNQEIKTFRQRAIIDTTNTLKNMEQARTEYRGALLWMKNVSEDLDPDTYKRVEKFRCVQAQVRKTKTSFDRLKVDSMQKIDLLAASRCNMLSHVLVGYQNTLLNFLEKTSQMMVAVAESFKGYQYYEFSVLRHLRPESRKLAGCPSENNDSEVNSDNDEESNSSEGVGYPHTPPKQLIPISPFRPSHSGYKTKATNYEMLKSSTNLVDEFFSCDQSNNLKRPNPNQTKSTDTNTKSGQFNLVPTEEELDKRLDEIFRTDDQNISSDLNSLNLIRTNQQFGNIISCGGGDTVGENDSDDRSTEFENKQSSGYSNFMKEFQDLLCSTNNEVPVEHRDLLIDLFSVDPDGNSIMGKEDQFIGQISLSSLNISDPNSQYQNTFKSEWDTAFEDKLDLKKPNAENFDTIGQFRSNINSSDVFRMSACSMLPSMLLENDGFKHSHNSTQDQSSFSSTTNSSSDQKSLKTGSELDNIKKTMQPTNLDAWMNLFADLGPMGNPDSLFKKADQISDA